MKTLFYQLTQRAAKHYIGPFYRNIGKKLYQYGRSVSPQHFSEDRLVESLRKVSYQGKIPSIQNVIVHYKCQFVAPNATIIGQIQIGQKSSIWYGAILRGQMGKIKIGYNTIIQDRVNIFNRNIQHQTKIGSNVLVSPNALLESCEVQNNSLIGMGSTIRKGAVVKEGSVVAAGAVILQNITVPSNQVWAGNPGRFIRQLNPQQKQIIRQHHEQMISLARIHREGIQSQLATNQDFRHSLSRKQRRQHMQILQEYNEQTLDFQLLSRQGIPNDQQDPQFMDQRVYLKNLEGNYQQQQWKRDYDPYENDMSLYPDQFKMYAENTNKYQEAKMFFQSGKYRTQKQNTFENQDHYDKKY